MGLGANQLRFEQRLSRSAIGLRQVADTLLLEAQSSDSAAVRLYCVDALATLGLKSQAIDWKSLEAVQKDRDVKKQILYAIERRGEPVAAAQLDELKSFPDGDESAFPSDVMKLTTVSA